ncbi:DUF2793 domain-containing protein [Aquicoccus sp. G2-2]|uniref:DUF2793 domain-containing protein n=1 Tax=Aquicoccus sp. G2-2 TaxID=3092120 RepID=UPI002ADF66C0|nr:DUF2793 domain-containing protein [Aquicoccus sp. G2-2]MEA1115083.1 DUF2793 domain-containing protein [Aquicoccus sp. G2-2]
MSDTSANLSLPFILPSQAQKHVTHNEALRRLDAVVQLSAISATETTPPAAPESGARFLLPNSASGTWSGQDAMIAVFEENAWTFIAPQKGWLIWIEDAEDLLAWDGANWIPALPNPDFQNLEHLGIQTTANTVNRFAVASDATLFTHAGAGHQLKLNKAATADTASLLFQTGWSGRAEMGTPGSDAFEIKVSADGTAFHTALHADPATGVVRFPSGVDGLSPPDFGTGQLTTTDYVASRNSGGVTNATGHLGTAYNYPAEFTFDPNFSPNLPASFSYAGYRPPLLSMTESISVDPNKVFRLGCYVRQEGLSGDWSSYANGERHQQYMGLLCRDTDGNDILSQNHMRYHEAGIDSLTTLAAPLTPGDTTITLSDASGWNSSSSYNYHRGVIIFGYRSGTGQLYSHYSRLFQFDLFDLGQIDKTTNIITLNQPFPAALANPQHPSGVWPEGTSLANTSASGYKYAFLSAYIAPEVDRWFHITNSIGGIDHSGTNNTSNFPPGTSVVVPFWLPNYSNSSGGYGAFPDTGAAHRVWFTGVSVMPEPLAAIQANSNGSKAIKVPVSDFATGTISLASPSFTVVGV